MSSKTLSPFSKTILMPFLGAILAFGLWVTPGYASDATREVDARYIASQTASARIFEGSLKAQRHILSAALTQMMGEKGYVVKDPDQFLDIWMEELIGVFSEVMQDEMAAAYLDLFSQSELRDIVDFYRTESGQALIRATPDMVAISTKLGAKAGQIAVLKTGRRFAERLEEEGILSKEDPSVLKQLSEDFQKQ